MSADYKQTDAARIQAIIAESKSADYDGHTEFGRLTPQQRLEWLDQAVLFIDAAQRNIQLPAPAVSGTRKSS